MAYSKALRSDNFSVEYMFSSLLNFRRATDRRSRHASVAKPEEPKDTKRRTWAVLVICMQYQTFFTNTGEPNCCRYSSQFYIPYRYGPPIGSHDCKAAGLAVHECALVKSGNATWRFQGNESNNRQWDV